MEFSRVSWSVFAAWWTASFPLTELCNLSENESFCRDVEGRSDWYSVQPIARYQTLSARVSDGTRILVIP